MVPAAISSRLCLSVFVSSHLMRSAQVPRMITRRGGQNWPGHRCPAGASCSRSCGTAWRSSTAPAGFVLGAPSYGGRMCLPAGWRIQEAREQQAGAASMIGWRRRCQPRFPHRPRSARWGRLGRLNQSAWGVFALAPCEEAVAAAAASINRGGHPSGAAAAAVPAGSRGRKPNCRSRRGSAVARGSAG